MAACVGIAHAVAQWPWTKICYRETWHGSVYHTDTNCLVYTECPGSIRCSLDKSGSENPGNNPIQAGVQVQCRDCNAGAPLPEGGCKCSIPTVPSTLWTSVSVQRCDADCVWVFDP